FHYQGPVFEMRQYVRSDVEVILQEVGFCETFVGPVDTIETRQVDSVLARSNAHVALEVFAFEKLSKRWQHFAFLRLCRFPSDAFVRFTSHDLSLRFVLTMYRFDAAQRIWLAKTVPK